jgi:glycosyltransferase involved in cell wall biosynthesis
MKKILFVLSDLPKIGPTNHTLYIIKAAMKKYEVSVLTLFDETDCYSVQDNYIAIGVKVECLHLESFINAIIKGPKKIAEYIKNNKVSVIHSYGTIADYICEKAHTKTNIPHIISLRVFPKEDLFSRMNFIKAWIAYSIHLSALKKCKHVVACSKSLLGLMRDKYDFAKKFIYIRNGVDVDKYSLDSNSCNNRDNNYICLSSIISRKRIHESIEGFLKSNISINSILYIVGDGESLDGLKMQFNEYKNVIFVGKTNDVQKYLNSCKYFISSSESEGLPNSLLEALSMGLIPIVSSIPQHLEVLEEINAVYYCYVLGNVDELCKTIDSIPYDIISNNRERIVSSSFNSTNMGKKYIDLYSEIIE